MRWRWLQRRRGPRTGGMAPRLAQRRRGRLLALSGIAVVAYAASLVATWPASHAWEHVERQAPVPDGLHVALIEGTVWDGSALGVSAGGLAVDRVSWALEPGSLLRGRAGFHIEADVPGGHAQAELAAGSSGIRLEGARGRLPADQLEPLARAWTEQLILEGLVTFSVDTAHLDRRGALQELDGHLAWQDAVVTVDHRVSLGGLESTLADDQGAIGGELEDTGGALRLDGSWRLEPDGRYTLDAVADTRDGAPGVLTRSLEMAGPRREEGVQLSIEGRL